MYWNLKTTIWHAHKARNRCFGKVMWKLVWWNVGLICCCRLEQSSSYRDCSFCVEPPKVCEQSLDIYEQYVSRGIHGAGPPTDHDLEIYRQYVLSKWQRRCCISDLVIIWLRFCWFLNYYIHLSCGQLSSGCWILRVFVYNVMIFGVWYYGFSLCTGIHFLLLK